MKFVCNGIDLFFAATQVSKAVNFKDKNSILSGIKITAFEDKIVFFATNGEISIEKVIKGEVFSEGDIIVPAKYLLDFIKKLDRQEVLITLTQKNEIKINYGDSEGFLQLLEFQKFPLIQQNENTTSFKMKGSEFLELVSMSYFCASTDDYRAIFKGELFEFSENKVKVIALDGFRFALIEKDIEGGNQTSIIVPAKSLYEISRFVKSSEEIELFADEKSLKVEIDGVKIMTRLYVGEFIKYKNIIPKDFEQEIVIDRNVFLEGLERVEVLLENIESRMVKFEIKENSLTLLCNSLIGSIKEKISCTTKGKDITLAFNVKYFLDVIKCIKDEFIKIKITGVSSPSIITSVEEKGDYFYMILPIKVL